MPVASELNFICSKLVLIFVDMDRPLKSILLDEPWRDNSNGPKLGFPSKLDNCFNKSLIDSLLLAKSQLVSFLSDSQTLSQLLERVNHFNRLTPQLGGVDIAPSGS